MAAPSQYKLNQYLKKQKELESRQKRIAEQYRKLFAQNRAEQKQIAAVIEEEQWNLLIKTLRETKFPIEQTALLIGLALEAADILNGSDSEDKQRRINELTARYVSFTNSEPAASQPAEPSGSGPSDAAAAPVSYAAAGGNRDFQEYH